MPKRVRSRIRGRNTILDFRFWILDFLSLASRGFEKIKSVKSQPKGYQRGRSPVVLLLLLLVWSISLGWGMAIAFGSPQGVIAQIAPQQAESALRIPAQPNLIAQGTADQTGTVDPITPRYQLG